jgi:hypothetical protein
MALNLILTPAADRQAIFLRESEPRAARPERCPPLAESVDRPVLQVVNGLRLLP